MKQTGAVANLSDKYIFSEENENLLAALKARTERIAPNAKVTYVLGKCDENIDKICNAIPKGSPENRVLSLAWSTRSISASSSIV